MKEERRNRRSGVGTGTTSLLMIFTLLCLSTLAMLSLSTAASDGRINERAYQNAQSQAAARGQAAQALALADETLLELQSEYDDLPQMYYGEAQQALQEMGFTVDSQNHTAQLITWVDEENQLVTTIALLPPGEEYRYTITSQMLEYIGDWEPETGGELWTGA